MAMTKKEFNALDKKDFGLVNLTVTMSKGEVRVWACHPGTGENLFRLQALGEMHALTIADIIVASKEYITNQLDEDRLKLGRLIKAAVENGYTIVSSDEETVVLAKNKLNYCYDCGDTHLETYICKRCDRVYCSKCGHPNEELCGKCIQEQ